MLHFLLILDNDPQRLAMTCTYASELMVRLIGTYETHKLHATHLSLLLWGSGRHSDIQPHVRKDDWCLGVGNWTGPREIPGYTDLREPHNELLASYDNAFCFLGGSATESEAYGMVDPVGRMHVYHASVQSGVRLVSNSALLLAALTNSELDTDSVRDFLAKGTVFGERSLFREVKKLAPGYIYRFRSKQISTHALTYPSIEVPDNEPDIIRIYEKNVSEALTEALGSNQRPLFDITGGFDSRLMLACAIKSNIKENISTVVVGNDEDKDVIVANMIARRFGIQHIHLRPIDDHALTAHDLKKALILTDGEYDAIEYAKIMYTHEILSKEFDISINGSGGEMIRDEWLQVFMRKFGDNKSWNPVRLANKRFATDNWAETMLLAKSDVSLSEHFSKLIETTVEHLGNVSTFRLVDEVYLYMRMQRWQGRIASATLGIWPNYSPLLAWKSIAIALQLPLGIRQGGRMPRLLLEHINPSLADVPMVDGAPASPLHLTNAHRHIPRYWSKLQYYMNAVYKRVIADRNNRSHTVSSEVIPELFSSFLNPKDMQSSKLYITNVLEKTIGMAINSRLNREHIGRLLTIELVCRTLNDIRKSD